jgi:hypothetical protein
MTQRAVGIAVVAVGVATILGGVFGIAGERSMFLFAAGIVTCLANFGPFAT